MRRQLVNPEQQPNRRDYRRDRRQYDIDEQRDFEAGADYIDRRHRSPDTYYDSVNDGPFQQHRDQRAYSEELYTPSFDYGYQRGEYYEREPWHHRNHRTQATGYGADRSPQSRDFERWLHSDQRFRNFNERYYEHPDFDREVRRNSNRDFEEGLYNYQGMEEEGRRSRHYSSDYELPHVDHYHNRTGRHLQIVRPFKDEREYGRNDYNHSEGYGSNEMVYHEKRRNRD